MVTITCLFVGLVATALLALLAACGFYFREAVRLCDTIGTMSPGRLPATRHPSEICTVTTCDGVRLTGTLLPARSAARIGVVAFCHEFGGDRDVGVRYLDRLRDDGFDVFTFNFRNHGDSEHAPNYDPRSWATDCEVTDILGVVDYLSGRPDADPRGVALLGISKGACAALSSAARSSKVWAVIADGAFVTTWLSAYNCRRFLPSRTRLAPLLERLHWRLFIWYSAVMHWCIARRLGHKNIDLLADVKRINQPVLLIHGERDRMVPAEMAPALWRKIGRKCRLWIVEGAKHNRSIVTAPSLYYRRVRRFLMHHALGEDHVSTVALKPREFSQARPAEVELAQRTRA